MKLLIIGAVLVLSVFARNCENPLFQSSVFQELGITMPKLRVAPSTQVSEAFCSELKDQSSCCSNAALVTMKKSFEKYESNLKASVEKILEKAVAHCDELDKIAAPAKLAARYENDRARILEEMAENADKCQSAALAHTRGVLCMGCATNTEEFISEENIVLLDGSALEDLNDACNAFIKNAVNFEKTVDNHASTLRAQLCKKVTLKVTNTAANTVNLCVHDETTAFHQYVNSVAKFIAAKYEFAPGYKYHYKVGKVFVCDNEGCEEETISTDAHTQFKNVISGASRKLVARKAVPQCDVDCVENRLRAAANGIFFNFDALMSNTQISTEFVAFVEDGYKLRQAANATTTTTTTTTNTTVKANSTDAAAINSLTDSLKTKLSNSTAQVDVYFGSATAMKVLLVPLALLGLVMLN
jgi:hypothetical protein